MDDRLVAMKMMCQIECVCARAFVRGGGVTPIIANRCAFVFNAPKKSSPSSALPLLFLRCARDDEIDGRSVYPSR